MQKTGNLSKKKSKFSHFFSLPFKDEQFQKTVRNL